VNAATPFRHSKGLGETSPSQFVRQSCWVFSQLEEELDEAAALIAEGASQAEESLRAALGAERARWSDAEAALEASVEELRAELASVRSASPLPATSLDDALLESTPGNAGESLL
jgi:hypothetical protein